MGEIMRACYRELGAELRKCREAAGVTASAVVEYTGWERTKVSRIEHGLAVITPVDVIIYAGACGLYRPQIRKLEALSRVAGTHDGYWLSPNGEWLEGALNSLIFHESTASDLVLYDPMVVNGLLQTADYARTLISRETWHGSEEIDYAVRVRMERRQILSRPRPAKFTFFVHEQAFRNLVGSAAVMHDQLLQVVLFAAMNNVTLRVVPSERVEQGALGCPFQVMAFDKHRPIAYVDNRVSGLFLEEEEFITPYRDQLVPLLANLAWDAGQSREFVASLANEYDRGSRGSHGGIHELEEEQL